MIKNSIKIMFAFLAFFIGMQLVFGFCSFDSYAADSLTSETVVHVSYTDGQNHSVVKDFKILPVENVKLALLYLDDSVSPRYQFYGYVGERVYHVANSMQVIDMETTRYSSSSILLRSFTVTLTSDGELIYNNQNIGTNENADIIVFSDWSGFNISTSLPIFGSMENLSNYFLTGDDSGQLNKGVGSGKHDFASDLVDTNIPLAELSNVSHNGFVLNNREDYNVDLYVESYLYGVRHSSFFPKVSFSVDTNWVYASHAYNFDSFTINTDAINMKSLFDVNNEGNLASDFMRWSSVYSKPSLLPDYAWYKSSSGSSSFDLHVYDSSLSESANLARSEQGSTVYYVRYYHMVDGQKIGGQWMQYTFRDGDGKGTMDNGVLISSGTVVGGGKVNVDSNGDIYITDSVTGSQDLQGNITYTSDSNDLFIDNAFSVIQDMANAIGKVPHLLELLFPFLPWWCTASLGAAIVICIILRIAGR